MWWLLSFTLGTVGGAAYLILQSLKKDAQEAREHWENTYLQVQDQVCQHRQAIAGHVESAQQYFDFHAMCELHFASVKLADIAYQRSDEAKTAVLKVCTHINDVRAKMEDIYSQTKAPGLNQFDCDKLHSELKDLKRLKEMLIRDADQTSEQMRHFLNEVRRLNRETRKLKCSIRDDCGWRGAEWYDQLEARTRARRSRQFS